jgi:hypothetical protein
MIRRTSSNGLREAVLYSIVMASSIGAYGLVLLLTVRTVLTGVFGHAFVPAAVLLLPTLLSFVVDAAHSGAALQLRARGQARRLAVAQAVTTLTRLGAVAALVSVFGLRGAAWGLLVGSGFGMVAFWAQVMLTTTRQRGHRDMAEPELSNAIQLAKSDWLGGTHE